MIFPNPYLTSHILASLIGKIQSFQLVGRKLPRSKEALDFCCGFLKSLMAQAYSGTRFQTLDSFHLKAPPLHWTGRISKQTAQQVLDSSGDAGLRRTTPVNSRKPHW